MATPPAELQVQGLGELRAAIAKRYSSEKSLDLDPESEILVTNGAQEGLFLTVLALLNPGERILVPDPRYGFYDQAIATAGGEIVSLPTGEGYDFGLTAKAVENADGKLLLLVNPSNPTGALTPAERVREISAVARDKGLIILSDEVYEKLTFDEEVLSVATCNGMRERTVTLSSVSKTYAMTGFRVGYVIGPPAFIEAATRLKSDISGPTSLFSQYAALAAIDGPQDSVEAFRQIYAGRLGVMSKGLDALNIPYGKPGGGFFLWADISRFGVDAEPFCRRLLTEGRVLMFPGTVWRRGNTSSGSHCFSPKSGSRKRSAGSKRSSRASSDKEGAQEEESRRRCRERAGAGSRCFRAHPLARVESARPAQGPGRARAK